MRYNDMCEDEEAADRDANWNGVHPTGVS